MTEYLTQADYEAIASKLTLPSQAFINGQFVNSDCGDTFASYNPASGQKLADIASCDKQDLDITVLAARDVFNEGTWSKQHPNERKQIIQKWTSLIEAHKQTLAVMESIDSGKPIHDCLTIDIPETIACLNWYAEAIDKLYDQISPSGHAAMGLILREPVGVVAAVLPWNFPLLMMAWKIGPAIAAGNSVIVKPAEQTSMTALYIAQLAKEAGLPDGVLSILPGLGEKIGSAIGLHQDIDVVSFTGSTEVGRMFLQYSAQSNLKKIVLECGGKSPSVVLSDAEDLDAIAEHIVNAVFWNMGENCTSNSRLIVHCSLKDELMSKVISRAQQWSLGHPLNPENQLGAMISAEHFDTVMGYIAEGKNQGAKLVLGGEALELGEGYFIKPTIFDNVSEAMTIAQEEIFGPVLAIITVDSDEQAIEIANNTAYGLQASVYSSNVKKALNAAKTIKAGTVSVNCYGEGDITTPFGGYKLSGFGGRDNSLQAFEQYTEMKTIWIDLEEN